jgi:ATP-dependent DNA helicase RecG
MIEDQHIEWKESWRDEYLKWVCAFANAQGGVLEIGRDSQGKVVGLADAAKLIEDLPNKMRDLIGIVADVDLLEEAGRPYIRITVEPYPYPVSYKGEYHVRSGSTKQVLKGAALDRFLLGRTGKRWDAVPVPGVSVGDLEAKTLARFRERAARSKRLGPEALEDDDAGLVEKLRLMEGPYLKRAAVLLFHPDPERFITGASIRIGYFESDADLRYHDEVHGNLFTQVDQTVDLLLTKYLKASISYEGLQRVETYPVPEGALREVLLNAVAHKDYASGVPIQISVYADRVLFWNNGQLPDDWTVERLKSKHPSQPYNPDVANAFFRAGMIEAWGRGIERVIQACLAHGLEPPELKYEGSGLWVTFRFRSPQEPRPEEAGTKPALSRHQADVLRQASTESSLVELMEVTGRTDRTKFRDQVLRPLLEAGLIAMTLPDKPKSPSQRYRLTHQGQTVLANLDLGANKS